MDKAVINNKIVSAYEISLDYELEKSVRHCSRNKEILCIDSCCKNPILRYCHGDKKSAYFAHLTNTECDYDKFDKNDNAVFKELRIKLFNHFSVLGYKVEIECKLLKHHYSQVFCSKDDESFVIEIGDSKTNIGYIEKLQQEYSSIQVPVKWLVVGDVTQTVRENNVSYLKRFLLNESKNNDFILVDGDKIAQFRLDKKEYELPDHKETYEEVANIQNLSVVNGELSIDGFDYRFEQWQNMKKNAIASELERRNKQRVEREKIELIRKQKEQEIEEQLNNYKKNHSVIINNQSNAPDTTSMYITKIYTCTKCGKKATEEAFFSMQGEEGECWECLYGPEEYARIKSLRGW
ncbi:MAG: hypothetical protein J6M26_01805 [Clostridia bacterium]|nr:hypothetical protein [Clostridia bacterium]